jgi:uncharacterized protein (TIGR03066 family)
MMCAYSLAFSCLLLISGSLPSAQQPPQAEVEFEKLVGSWEGKGEFLLVSEGTLHLEFAANGMINVRAADARIQIKCKGKYTRDRRTLIISAYVDGAEHRKTMTITKLNDKVLEWRTGGKVESFTRRKEGKE